MKLLKRHSHTQSLFAEVILLGLLLAVLPHPKAFAYRVTSYDRAHQTERYLELTYVPDEIIIGLKEDYAQQGVTPGEVCQRYNLSLTESHVSVKTNSLGSPSPSNQILFSAKIPNEANLEAIISTVVKDPRVRYAEKRWLIPVDDLDVSTTSVSIAAEFSLRDAQWALSMLQVPDNLECNNTVVAIIDTGFNFIGGLENHIIGGYDFRNNSPDFSSINMHGTHVAGVVVGQFGVFSRCALLAYKAEAQRAGFVDHFAAIRAMDAAIKFKQETGKNVVVNASWQVLGVPSQALSLTIERLQDAGILFICAAGNEATNYDEHPTFFDNENLISVASSDRTDTPSSYSNIGRKNVDVFAPGESIVLLDTSPGDIHMGLGTSLAAPFVSAQATKLFDLLGDWRAVKERIVRTVEYAPSLQGKVWSDGRISFGRALRAEVNPALDSISITKAKLKKGKKLTLKAFSTPTSMHTPPVPATLTVYAEDRVLGVMDFDSTDKVYAFSFRGKFASSTRFIVRSSFWGEAEWIAPALVANNKTQQRSYVPLAVAFPALGQRMGRHWGLGGY